VLYKARIFEFIGSYLYKLSRDIKITIYNFGSYM